MLRRSVGLEATSLQIDCMELAVTRGVSCAEHNAETGPAHRV